MAGPSRLTDAQHVVAYAKDGSTASATAVPVYVAPRQMTLRSAYYSVATTPAGTAETIVIDIDGTAAGTVTLAAGATSDEVANIDTVVAKGARITLDITQAGTTPSVDPILVLEFD